jgi:hypothetical protein
MKRSVVTLGFALLACAGGSTRPSASETPAWLSEGTGAVTTESGKQVHAIGVASGVRDSKARRQQADSKARAQLDELMDRVLTSVAKMSDPSAASGIQTVGRKAAAETGRIMDHWVAQDGTESALAVVDVAAFKQALQSVEGDDRAKLEIANKIDRALEQTTQK